jgi:hypothetical protein
VREGVPVGAALGDGGPRDADLVPVVDEDVEEVVPVRLLEDDDVRANVELPAVPNQQGRDNLRLKN